MRRSQKIISKSKLSEWKGLDRIQVMVHEMQCIWREQEKDDIGIDGEIELCRPREDGEGMYGTGKILKVQSKSGSRYVVKDNERTFASPVDEKDLRYWRELNLPAIYVVYHPDDDSLYWKHIQAYLEVTPGVFTPPLRIEFDKETERFDKSAYATLVQLCELAPERVLTDGGETLFSNVLPVLSLPSHVFVTVVLPEKRPSFHDRITGGLWIPPYQYINGMVITLTDPNVSISALTDVIDEGTVEAFDLEEWLVQDSTNVDRLRALLNSVLHRHLRHLGLDFLKTHRRYFYNRGLAEDSPIRKTWTSARTKRTQPRNVAKFHEYGRNRFYRHLAVDARFERFGESWGVVITPKVHFSTDGKTRWEGKAARSYAIKARIEEWNDVFLNNVLFWAHELSSGKDEFALSVDDVPVCHIQGVPLSVETDFKIEAIALPDRRPPKEGAV